VKTPQTLAKLLSFAKEEQNKKGCSFEQPFYFGLAVP
jgi:hypothetical protein